MLNAAKILFIASVVLGVVAVLVVSYIWIGSTVLGINTSHLDPAQGPSWPMDAVVWSLAGALVSVACGVVLTIVNSRRRSKAPRPH